MIVECKRFFADDSGQDLIEYSLLAGLISLVAVTVVINVGTGVNVVWGGVGGTSCALEFSWTLDCERVLAGGVSR